MAIRPRDVVEAGLARSGKEARRLIAAGRITEDMLDKQRGKRFPRYTVWHGPSVTNVCGCRSGWELASVKPLRYARCPLCGGTRQEGCT